MWNNLSKGLLAAVIAAGALTGYFFWERMPLQQRADENEKKAQTMEQQLRRRARRGRQAVEGKRGRAGQAEAGAERNASEPEKEVEAGEVMVNQLADRLSVKILDKILFPSGEAAISAKGQNVLKRVGKVLASARDKDKIIRIEGHTD